ncbi:MAG: sigma 54-interacting transcriptional regulator [Candidatus Riflebacteria bacterium]|nr:sigma 54-interacting transcriptional regulator [Candidatus Riflebacteria bacterium]
MSTKQRVGFSILDNEQDKAGAVNTRRWRIFRSTLAFALQESFPLDFLTILWQPSLKGQIRLLERTIADIRSRAATRGLNIAIQALPVEFSDPFHLQECFRVLWETLQSEDSGDAQLFLNLNNGTHTMQMAMFLLAKYRLDGRPINLLQVYRNRSIDDPVPANTYQAQARLLDLRWEKLQPLERRIRKEKDEIYHAISLQHSRHREVEQLYREIVDIGCYTDDLILLTGPTGSGKSRIAEEVHHGWARRLGRPRAPFFELNAAGLSGDLIRSTLFGHTKGAFTGATEDRDGFLLAAHQGTLFLDEIGELDLRSQAELLLAIETKSFYPVGSTKRRTSEFRLLCATNRDLRVMVQQGTFREDLFARIRCWEFHLPGIRDLPKDFEANVDFELKLCNAEEFRKGNPEPFQVFFEEKAKAGYLTFAISSEAIWTGNFRDLKFSVRRMATKARLAESTITTSIANEEIERLRSAWSGGGQRDIDSVDVLRRFEQLARKRHPRRNLIDAIEALLLSEGLQESGNKAQTARRLYESAEKPLANPSNRFRERYRSLFEDS